MSTPAIPTPEQIEEREFATVKRGGYDPEQVRAYLRRISGVMESLKNELAQSERRFRGMQDQLAKAQEQAREAASKADPYAELGHRVADLLRTAEAEADKIRAEAHSAAERVRSDSRAMLGTLKQDAEALLQAGDSLRGTLNGMRERIDRIDRANQEGTAPDLVDVREGDPEQEEAQPNQPSEAVTPSGGSVKHFFYERGSS